MHSEVLIVATADCLPQRVVEKGASVGGQGEVETWYMPGPGGWYDFHLNWASDRIEVSSTNDTLVDGPVWVTYDPETRRITPHGVPDGWMVQINYAASGSYTNPTRLPGNISCTDVDGLALKIPSPDLFMYYIVITGGVTLTAAQAEAIGDLGEVLMTYSVGGVTFPGQYDDLICGQLEQATTRWETPAEMQTRLGTLVPPVEVDGAGLASIDLPEGCYFFGVSAVGYATQYSDEECLASGDVVPNVFDLVADPRGSVAKMFCYLPDEGDCTRTIWFGPRDITVWLVDADGE